MISIWHFKTHLSTNQSTNQCKRLLKICDQNYRDFREKMHGGAALQAFVCCALVVHSFSELCRDWELHMQCWRHAWPCEATPYDTEWDLVCVSPGSKASIYCYLIGNLTPSQLPVKPWHLHRTHTSLARGEIHPTHTQWSQNSYLTCCNHTAFGLMYESSHYVVCVCVCVCVCVQVCRWAQACECVSLCV